MRRFGVTATACDRTEAGNEAYQKKDHRIRDDGKGISPELLPHIFDRFFSTRKDGTGIGLALAREIVALHRGTIKAENDGGAVFEISLPVKNR